jgi:hypothetical protein
MDTDYVIDNGLIQVREDGGYIARHNPMLSAKINWSYFPYPFFNFKNDETTVSVLQEDDVKLFDLSQLQVTDMRLTVAPDNSSASIYISKESILFTWSQVVTVYRGLQFVNTTITLYANTPNVFFTGAVFTLQSKGISIDRGTTVGFYDAGGKVLGQVIFTKGQPAFDGDGPTIIYNFTKKASVELELWSSAFSVDNRLQTLEDPNTQIAIDALMVNNLASFQQQKEDNNDLQVFDYKQALKEWNVSYIAVRDPAIKLKFMCDPKFSLVFISNDIAIFAVE